MVVGQQPRPGRREWGGWQSKAGLTGRKPERHVKVLGGEAQGDSWGDGVDSTPGSKSGEETGVGRAEDSGEPKAPQVPQTRRGAGAKRQETVEKELQERGASPGEQTGGPGCDNDRRRQRR